MNDTDKQLFEAIESNEYNRITELIRRGGNPNAVSEDGVPATVYAMNRGFPHCLTSLLDGGAEIEKKDEDGYTLTLLASMQSCSSYITALIKRGANVNAQTKDGRTALMLTQCYGVVISLIKEGAYIHLTDYRGDTALSYACRNGNENIVELLLRYGADVNTEGFEDISPLHCAKSTNIIKMLLEYGADINKQTCYGDTALWFFCRSGDTEYVKLLIDNGADVNIRDKNGFTPLCTACNNNYPIIVKMLLEYGADMVNTNGLDCTPISNAYGECLRILADHLYSSKLEEKRRVVFTLIGKGRVLDLRALLVKKAFDINITGKGNTTPLMSACTRGDIYCFKLFLEMGADIDISNEEGYTAEKHLVWNIKYKTGSIARVSLDMLNLLHEHRETIDTLQRQ